MLLAEHRDGAAEGLEDGDGGHPPEHGGKGVDVVGGEEVRPRGGDVGGEVSVATKTPRIRVYYNIERLQLRGNLCVPPRDSRSANQFMV